MKIVVEIQKSKTKSFALALMSLLFVACGVWFVFYTPHIQIPIVGHPIFLKTVGMLSIVFFGITFIAWTKSGLDRKPGIAISEEGIFDNSSGVSLGFIPWSDVNDIQVVDVAGQKFINVVISDPEKYINGVKSVFKRIMVRLNYKSYNSIVAISANGLKCTHQELLTLITEAFEKYKGANK